MVLRWLSEAPGPALGACLLVALAVGLTFWSGSGSIVLALVAVWVVFDLSSLLVARSPGFRSWKPGSRPARAARAYVRFVVFTRSDPVRRTLSRLLTTGMLTALAIVVVLVVRA